MEKLKLIEQGAFRVAMAIGLGGLVTAACGVEGPEYQRDRPAVVIDREYHKPYTSIIPAGKVFIPIYHNEEYHFDVLQCASEQDYSANTDACVSAHVEVDKETYDTYPNGSKITLKS